MRIDVTTKETGKKTNLLRLQYRPRYCVWELTLRCNLRCSHCGSSAGKARGDELGLHDCLDIVEQLDELGCEVVSLSGGEPTLNPHWDTIARAIADRGMRVNMVTNGIYRGRQNAADIAKRARASGMCNVGLSLDGPREVHEEIRGPGTFDQTMESLATFRREGVPVAVITTVSRLNLEHLATIHDLVAEAGTRDWRVQIAKPMGTMKENNELVIEPAQLPRLISSIVALKKRGKMHLHVGDSIGYYGPYERRLRNDGHLLKRNAWRGCQAGLQVIGIQADGSVKGCLSLQTKNGDEDPWVEGNVREQRLHEIWSNPEAFAYNRAFKCEDLTGFCSSCRHGKVCRAGATCIAAATTGGTGEDPYCSYRIHELAQPTRGPQIARTAAAAAAAALVLSIGPAGCRPQPEYMGPDPSVYPPPAATEGSGEEPVLFDPTYMEPQPEYMVLPPDFAEPEGEPAEEAEEAPAPESEKPDALASEPKRQVPEAGPQPEYMVREPWDGLEAEYMAPYPVDIDEPEPTTQPTSVPTTQPTTLPQPEYMAPDPEPIMEPEYMAPPPPHYLQIEYGVPRPREIDDE